MIVTDQYGLALSTDSAGAAEAYIAGLDLSLLVEAAAVERFAAALALDPRFALARAAVAFHLQFDPDPAAGVGQALMAANHAAGATARERQHVEILRRAALRDWSAVAELAPAHLAEHPRDVLVLWQLVRLLGYGGDPDRKHQAVADLDRRASDYGGDRWFAAVRSLALAEVGRLDEAERLADEGLAAEPGHTLLAHSRTHVAFERGDDEGGRDYLAGWLESYSGGMAAGHLRWHVGVSDIALGRADAALARLRAATDVSMHDAASLLWRLHLRGFDVETDMRALADAPVSSGINNTFDLAHLALVRCALGDVSGLDQMRQPHAPGALVAELFGWWIDALRLLVDGRWADAVGPLGAVCARVQVLGGSNEQHELFHETLAAARRRLPA